METILQMNLTGAMPSKTTIWSQDCCSTAEICYQKHMIPSDKQKKRGTILIQSLVSTLNEPQGLDLALRSMTMVLLVQCQVDRQASESEGERLSLVACSCLYSP